MSLKQSNEQSILVRIQTVISAVAPDRQLIIYLGQCVCVCVLVWSNNTHVTSCRSGTLVAMSLN